MLFHRLVLLLRIYHNFLTLSLHLHYNTNTVLYNITFQRRKYVHLRGNFVGLHKMGRSGLCKNK